MLIQEFYRKSPWLHIHQINAIRSKHFYYNPDFPDNPELSIPVWKGYGSCTVDGYGHNYPNTGQSSTCPGDSGSPVFWEDINDNQRAYMIGKNNVEKTIMQRFGE